MPASTFFPAGSSLYLILDGEICAAKGLAPTDFLIGAVAGGASVIQYRHKNISGEAYEANLKKLLQISEGSQARLVVNDHAVLAEKYSLSLHLGQGDLLPSGLKVPYGRSTHNATELAWALGQSPAPAYVALGTMFSSMTKPDVISARNLIPDYLTKTALPLVLIGGITLENVFELPQSSEIFYAVISDVFRFGATKAGIQKYVSAWPPHPVLRPLLSHRERGRG